MNYSVKHLTTHSKFNCSNSSYYVDSVKSLSGFC